jgi:TonB family protein
MNECLGDSTRIDEIREANGLTSITITAYAHCNGNLEGRIGFKHDTLTLIYSPKMTRVVDKNTGKVSEITELADCDCIFKFHYTISELKSLHKNRIKINGETLDRINQRSIRDEAVDIEFEVDSAFSSDAIFVVPGISAHFPGGMEKFEEYIANSLIYPKEAEKNRISGKVYVEIVINKDGSIDDATVKVVRGLIKPCDDEAIRLMRQCPDWTLAKVRGQPVKQRMIIPVRFALPRADRPPGK